MQMYCIHGGNAKTAKICARSGWAYGVQFGYKHYAPPEMVDYVSGDWQNYLRMLRTHKPQLAVCADFRARDEWETVNQKMIDVAGCGVMPVVVAKWRGALRLIPEIVLGIPSRIGVSVPVKRGYMDDGFMPDANEFKRHSYDTRSIHLLGGHPDQWLYLKRYYADVANVASADGNILYNLARDYGKMWSRYGGYIELRGRGYSTKPLAIASMRNAIRYIDLNHYDHSSRIARCKQQLSVTLKQLPLFDIASDNALSTTLPQTPKR